MLAKTNMSICTAIMAHYTRKRNEGKLTTWGLFSSNGKLPSSVFLRLIHQVLFVTSNSGSSSTWTLRAGLQAAPLTPPWPGHCCWFCFWRCFFAARGISLWGQSTKRPFGSAQGAGQPQNQAGWPAHTGAFHSGAGHFVPLLNSGRAWASERETLEKERVRGFTLEPNHMVSSGKGGRLELREEGLEFGLTHIGFGRLMLWTEDTFSQYLICCVPLWRQSEIWAPYYS